MHTETIRTVKILIWGVFFLIVFFGILNRTLKSNYLESPGLVFGINTKQEVPKLNEIIFSTFNNPEIEYGIVIKNLKTGESTYINEHKKFATGSLYKLWVMGEAFNQVKNGTIQSDDTIEQSIETLNDKFGISDDEAELTEGVINMTVNSALTQMITISHNYAALLLSEKLKLSNISKFIKNNQFNESSLSIEGSNYPETTAVDMAVLLEKIYKGELVNKESSDKMLNLLKAQRLNNKLPKDLPKIMIAHKTGEIDDYSHDVGIVYSDKGDYIIAVLTKSPDPVETEDKIGELSKKIYDYFYSKSEQ